MTWQPLCHTWRWQNPGGMTWQPLCHTWRWEGPGGRIQVTLPPHHPPAPPFTHVCPPPPWHELADLAATVEGRLPLQLGEATQIVRYTQGGWVQWVSECKVVCVCV